MSTSYVVCVINSKYFVVAAGLHKDMRQLIKYKILCKSLTYYRYRE